MKKEKIEINEKMLENEIGYKTTIIFTIIFIIASIIIVLSPFTVINKLSTFNLICDFIACILFSLMFNLIPLIKLNKKKKIIKQIRNKHYKVVLDQITNIEVTLSGENEYPSKNHYLTLKEYSKIYNKDFPIYSDLFRKVQKGDFVYLIFIDNNTSPFLIFKSEDYYYNGILSNIKEIKIKDNKIK